MLCAVTIRSITPGSFDAFRREWEPRPWEGIFEVVEELVAPGGAT
jgi:hypothetical protein